MLKLRPIGIRDYSVLEGEQRIGRIRFAGERHAALLALERRGSSDRWTSDGPAGDLDTAKADFKAAWEGLKAKTSPEELAAAYKAMNIDDDKSPDDK